MAEDLGERTEEATPRRRQETREEGKVARSQDLAGALLLLSGTVVLWLALSPMLTGLGELVAGSLRSAGEVKKGSDPFFTARAMLIDAGVAAVRFGGPILAGLWIAAGLAHLSQIGWVFAPAAVKPRFSKLDPIKGFGRIFGLSSAVKALMDSLKVAIVIAVAVLTCWGYSKAIVTLAYLDPPAAAARAGAMLLDLALRVLAVLLVLGVLDLLYQRWKHLRDMRMTRHEVKDELKQTEGDPEVKKRRLRMQQQIAMQRISAAVPKADVVVTNPEHVAVAIQYDGAKMNAPKVVARGADYLAMRIRQIALAHGIPIVERKPLARALYAQVRVGQEIPPQFYQAVAEILAYVYRLSGRSAA